jgi:Cu/Ag efflux protein CusF
MKSTAHLALMFFSLMGCATYQLQPLGMNHPANPEAVAAPMHSVSKTLAYTREDIPSVQPVSAASAETSHEGHHPAKAEQKTVVGEGKVVATVPSASQVVVEHGEIKGFMEPMTMGYQVDPPSLTEELKPGDKVRFTIDVPRKTIVKIEKIH